MEVSQHCEDCKRIDETTVHLYEKCVACGHLVKENDTCPCITAKLWGESAERIRYLMSLGHPGEHGEPYSRWDMQEECRRRGKQLLVDLGWPTEPDAIYKNKYTGSEHTLREGAYAFCMDREKNDSFEQRLKDHVWSIIEHSWPKDKFVDTDMMDEYKSTLSYFKDTHQDLSIADDEMDELSEDSEDSEDSEYVESDIDNVVREKRKDKAQMKLEW